eukprot:1185829-Prorocentrum_minimum.AAC.1
MAPSFLVFFRIATYSPPDRSETGIAVGSTGGNRKVENWESRACIPPENRPLACSLLLPACSLVCCRRDPPGTSSACAKHVGASSVVYHGHTNVPAEVGGPACHG